MKRSLLLALTIGAIVGALVLWLHISGAALRLELPLSGLLSRGTTSRVVSEKLQAVLVFVISAGVAWMLLETLRRSRIAMAVGLLAIELLAVTWVCSLFGIFFQPLPTILAAGLSLGATFGLVAFLDWRASRPEVVFEDRLSERQIDMIKTGEVPVQAASKSYDVTVVVADIGNKHDLSEELEPTEFAELMARFIAHTSKTFLNAGAYIEAAAGEGVVAIFGYPNETTPHADKATREAMKLVDSFATPSNGEAPLQTVTLNAGVSSGRIVAAPVRGEGDRSGTILVGEPVELARRFCIANRFYGSRVLIGPRTFELAGQALIARPIDFLSGVDVRERHEVYEPISLAEEASQDAIQRRDWFWNGVVLYREKRWAEAYAHFQKARSPEHPDDPPLQLYLRRLEPLALQLTNALPD